MVDVIFEPSFKKKFRKIKDAKLKVKIRKQLSKIISDPEIGKPMKFERKRTSELYVPPFRLSYFYSRKDNVIILGVLFHKDKQ